jgi:acyl-CoA thioesterase FadM
VKSKSFTHEHRVFFNETNAMGGVAYFSNYPKWQGIVREEYFVKTVPEWREVMKFVTLGKVNMITVEEHSHFKHHVFFGDKVIIKLQTTNIRKCSFDMLFKFYRNSEEELIYEGWQKLAFDDYKGNFIPIPEPMLRSVLEYRIENGEYHRKYGNKDRVPASIS